MTDRIEAALAAADKATPGPWAEPYYNDYPGDQGWWVHNGKEGASEYAVAVTFVGNPRAEHDATLIAAAPDLAAEVIRLRKWQSEAVPYLHKEIEQCKAVLGIGICECEVCTAARIRGQQLTRLIAEAEGE